MNTSLRRNKISLGMWALMLGLAACAGTRNPPETAETAVVPGQTDYNAEAARPNSADINQEDMKESEKAAEERREEATEEAIKNVDNASVLHSDKEDLKTDDVDTDPND